MAVELLQVLELIFRNIGFVVQGGRSIFCGLRPQRKQGCLRYCSTSFQLVIVADGHGLRFFATFYRKRKQGGLRYIYAGMLALHLRDACATVFLA